MTPGRQLKLGTAAQLAQAGAIRTAAHSIPAAPEELPVGAEVWAHHYGRWYLGRIASVIRINPSKQRQGIARGDRAVVQLEREDSAEVNHRTRIERPLAELVPAVDDEPGPHANREAAREFARWWWAEHRQACAEFTAVL